MYIYMNLHDYADKPLVSGMAPQLSHDFLVTISVTPVDPTHSVVHEKLAGRARFRLIAKSDFDMHFADTVTPRVLTPPCKSPFAIYAK